MKCIMVAQGFPNLSANDRDRGPTSAFDGDKADDRAQSMVFKAFR